MKLRFDSRSSGFPIPFLTIGLYCRVMSWSYLPKSFIHWKSYWAETWRMSRVFRVRRRRRGGIQAEGSEGLHGGGNAAQWGLGEPSAALEVRGLARRPGVAGCGSLGHGVEEDPEAESLPGEKACRVDGLPGWAEGGSGARRVQVESQCRWPGQEIRLKRLVGAVPRWIKPSALTSAYMNNSLIFP